jgi:hypothetical protein
MPVYISGADQNGLREEEDYPTEVHRTVEPEDGRSRNGNVKEALVNGTAEAPNHYCRKQQGHGEIKVFIDEPQGPCKGFHGARRSGLRKRSHVRISSAISDRCQGSFHSSWCRGLRIVRNGDSRETGLPATGELQIPHGDKTYRALTVPRLPLINIDSSKAKHERINAEDEQEGGCMNKTMALAAVLILCAPVIAKENPADFTLKAHIVSVITPKDGPIPGPPLRCLPPQIGETKIQIDNVVYTAECRHKDIQAGQNYPAQLNEKGISLLSNEKAISFRVREKQDAKQ